MNNSTLQLQPTTTLSQSWPQSKEIGEARARKAQHGDSRQFGVLSYVASMLAGILYTVISLTMAAVVIVTLILILPWLLLLPVIVIGLLISLAGFVLSSLGLI